MTAELRPEQSEQASFMCGITYDQMSRAFQLHGIENLHEWAGIPIPIEGLPMIVEPRYPYQIGDLLEEPKPDDNTEPDAKLRNYWRCARIRREVFVYEELAAPGRVKVATLPHDIAEQRFHMQMNTLKASWCYSIEAEIKAQSKLLDLLNETQQRYYIFSGAFMESSARSGITYMFRRQRPTLALGHTKDRTRRRLIAALCLHPIAFYVGSFAGAMTPTDEIIAHLMLMRGDEKLYWRRSNQHNPNSLEAGV